MSLVMVAESLVAVPLVVWMEMIKPQFCQAILAALIEETLPLMQVMRLVERLTEAEFPVERVGMSQMVEVALGYAKTSLLIAVAVDASFAMFAKTVKKFVALIPDVGTRMYVLALLNAAGLPKTNVLVMILWQLVGILMSVVLLFVSVLMNPLTAAVAPVLSIPNAVQLIVTRISQMFVKIPLETLSLLAH